MEQNKKCAVSGCDSLGQLCADGHRYYIHGYCSAHYQKFRKYGDPLYVHPIRTKCIVDGCNRVGDLLQGGNRCFIKGYCVSHYKKLIRHGNALAPRSVRGRGISKNPLYGIYGKIKDRCYNVNSPAYKNYGGRGIKMCKRWLGVDGALHFYEDMGERPSKKHSIDRIDNNKGYCKDNCRWATWHEQASNTRANNDIVGVSFSKNRWMAELTVNRTKYRKPFKLYEDAVTYRKELERLYLPILSTMEDSITK